MSEEKRDRFKKWLESQAAQLHPLTFPQRELWEASPAPVTDVSNHICCMIDVRGEMSQQDSTAALQQVVNRQDVLRLSFLPGKNGPIQLVRKKGKAEMRFHDVSPQTKPEEIEELALGSFHKPFDLLQGPLYRVEVLRRAANDQVFVFSIHHAIADGWTLGIFVQDLCAAYIQEFLGTRKELGPLSTSYFAWGAAERAFWQGPELESRINFWKSQLAGTRRLWSGADQSKVVFAPRRLVLYLEADICSAVRELARRNGATLFIPFWRPSKSRCHAGEVKMTLWLELLWRIELPRVSAKRWDISRASCLYAAKLNAIALFPSICGLSTKRPLIRLPTPCPSQNLFEH